MDDFNKIRNGDINIIDEVNKSIGKAYYIAIIHNKAMYIQI